MAHPGPVRCPHKVADLRRVLADPPAGGAVQDDPGTLDCGLDAFIVRQVAHHVLAARRGIVGAPAEHPHLPPGFTKPWNDPTAKSASASGISPPVLIST